MKKLLILSMLLTSCGFFKTRAPIDNDPAPPPPVVPSEEDPTRVLYNPNYEEERVVDVLSGDNETCKYREIILISSEKALEQAIKDVWYTKKRTIEQTYPFSELVGSDHLHITHVTLESTSGDNLFFINWLTSRISGEDVVWSHSVYDPNSPRKSELEFDGSRDIRLDLEQVSDTMVSLKFEGEARGKSPRQDTTIELQLHLSSFYDCR